MAKTNISLPTVLLTGLVAAAVAFRDGLKQALDSIDQNHAAYDELQAKYDQAQADLAALQQHVADEETLEDEPDLKAQITDLTADPGTGGGDAPAGSEAAAAGGADQSAGQAGGGT